uniref:Uncharacterized protein n=1 Tax=Mycena chlorophos TaxID=658473 RepID=A0ABQ0MD99_MYCCL|nr:predicted protein [Mycena chlorophos]
MSSRFPNRVGLSASAFLGEKPLCSCIDGIVADDADGFPHRWAAKPTFPSGSAGCWALFRRSSSLTSHVSRLVHFQPKHECSPRHPGQQQRALESHLLAVPCTSPQTNKQQQQTPTLASRLPRFLPLALTATDHSRRTRDDDAGPKIPALSRDAD